VPAAEATPEPRHFLILVLSNGGMAFDHRRRLCASHDLGLGLGGGAGNVLCE